MSHVKGCHGLADPQACICPDTAVCDGCGRTVDEREIRNTETPNGEGGFCARCRHEQRYYYACKCGAERSSAESHADPAWACPSCKRTGCYTLAGYEKPCGCIVEGVVVVDECAEHKRFSEFAESQDRQRAAEHERRTGHPLPARRYTGD